MRNFVVLGLVTVAAWTANGGRNDGSPVPAGGHAILGPIMQTYGEAESSEYGKVRVIGQDELSAGEALEIEVYKKGNDWDLQVAGELTEAIKKDDVLLVTFRARTLMTADESGQSLVYVGLEVPNQWKRPEKEKSLLQPITRRLCITAGSDWTRHFLKLRAPKDFDADDLFFNMRCGSQRQTVQFADLQVLNYGSDIEYASLPETKPTYAGREPDAPWRKEALARIEKLRRRDLQIVVRDTSGRPVPNARVEVELKRHAFGFGAAVTAEKLLETSAGHAEYRRRIIENFSSLSFVNALKPRAFAGDWGEKHPGVGLEALKWVKETGLPFRGHCLVWPRKKSVGEPLKAMLDAKEPDPAAIRAAISAHIRDACHRTAFWMQEWDVLNESIPCYDVQRICGDEVMVEWFREARKALPGVDLALNEYALLSSLTDTKKLDQHEARIRYLLENEAPLDVLGFQGHFGGQPPSPIRILSVLDRFGSCGLKMRVTEFDTKIEDPALQYDFARDFYIALFSHSRVVGVQHWGIIGTVFDEGFNYTAIGRAHHDLVQGEWHTRETGRTKEDGTFACRAFLGSYEISVVVDGERVATRKVELEGGPEAQVVTVSLADFDGAL